MKSTIAILLTISLLTSCSANKEPKTQPTPSASSAKQNSHIDLMKLDSIASTHTLNGNHVAAMNTYKIMSERNAQASYEVGRYYERGLGVTRDYDQARMWYEKAINQTDNIHAQYRLGVMYYKGLGFPKNYTVAYNWLLTAAGRGHTDAMRDLSMMYANGDGIPKDPKKAKYWLLKSSEVDKANDLELQRILSEIKAKR